MIIWFAEPYIICFLCIPNGIKWWWQVQSHFCIDLILLCLCLFLYQPRSASWNSLFFSLLAYQHSFSLSFGWWVIFLWRLFLGVHRKLFISFFYLAVPLKWCGFPTLYQQCASLFLLMAVPFHSSPENVLQQLIISQSSLEKFASFHDNCFMLIHD